MRLKRLSWEPEKHEKHANKIKTWKFVCVCAIDGCNIDQWTLDGKSFRSEPFRFHSQIDVRLKRCIIASNLFCFSSKTLGLFSSGAYVKHEKCLMRYSMTIKSTLLRNTFGMWNTSVERYNEMTELLYSIIQYRITENAIEWKIQANTKAISICRETKSGISNHEFQLRWTVRKGEITYNTAHWYGQVVCVISRTSIWNCCDFG